MVSSIVMIFAHIISHWHLSQEAQAKGVEANNPTPIEDAQRVLMFGNLFNTGHQCH